MTYAFIFPGQGSQFIGMGADLADSFSEAKEVFQEVDDAIETNLSAIMFSGDADELNLTENTQPALMAVSVAVWRVLEKQGNLKLNETSKFVAGHSLGEYSALTVAKTFDLSDTARLLKLRGQAMQRSVPVGVGAMAAIIGMDFDDVVKLAEDAAGNQTCAVANDNSIGQVVISGHKEAVERAAEMATERGAKKAVMLPVSAPFHCDLMSPAAEAMLEALQNTKAKTPAVPVVCNVTAQAENDETRIRSILVEQVTGMVRWRESVQYMKKNGVKTMIELGAGKVLCGLIRRIDRDIETHAVGTPEGIGNILEILK